MGGGKRQDLKSQWKWEHLNCPGKPSAKMVILIAWISFCLCVFMPRRYTVLIIWREERLFYKLHNYISLATSSTYLYEYLLGMYTHTRERKVNFATSLSLILLHLLINQFFRVNMIREPGELSLSWSQLHMPFTGVFAKWS